MPKNDEKNRFAALASELEMTPGLVFGIDVGISSCGWAVVDLLGERILAMGSRCFDAPENPKNKTLYNAERRTKRGMRRVTYRRKGRMKGIRRLMREWGLLDDPSHEFFQRLGDDQPDPWEARARGVTQSLEREDAAAALLHLAKHRGFKSNAKRDTSSGDGETGKVLKAASEWENKFGERTYGQMLNDHHPDRKRNRSGDYSFMPSRKMLREEAQLIISRQRALGAEWATHELEAEYLKLAFDQLLLRSSEDLVGRCPFEPSERRAARFSYSFELFRLLETLIHKCRVVTEDGNRPLTPDELERAVAKFGQSQKLTFTALRKATGMLPTERFVNATDAAEEKKDVTKISKGSMVGSNVLRKALGAEAWERLRETPATLDRIAEIITFNEDDAEIERKLAQLDLDEDSVGALVGGISKGAFKDFKGTGHISAEAARKLIPEMLKGNRYDEACNAVGYDHAAARDVNVQNIKNPVVQRSLNQAIKQVEVLVKTFGRPERIHVELLRDVGKSAQIRGEIDRSLRNRTKEREGNETELKELTGQSGASRDDVQMFELMKEQGYRCPYCDKHLTPDMIPATEVQVDHIYPRSRSHEDSYVNKVLTCVPCNQDKRNRTPWEWRGRTDPQWWRELEARVSSFSYDKPEKKRRLLNKSFGERELDFIERNKVDSSYVARVLLANLQQLYPESYRDGAIFPGAERRLASRPGTMTPKLQWAWLGDRYKKNRNDDRHHAVDALFVAFMEEPLYQKIASIYQRWEETGQQQHYVPSVEPPWDGFAEDCLNALAGKGLAGEWLVCRTERRRSRGALHEETIRRKTVDDDGNEVYWQRKQVESLTKSDLRNIPDPVMREVVTAWHTSDKKQRHQRPVLTDGTEVRKVRVATKIATSTQINRAVMGGKRGERQGGFVSNADMVRVDVYFVSSRKPDAAFQATLTRGYYLVPVYAHQATKNGGSIPIKATVGGQPETQWPEMDRADFVFSLYKDSYVEIETRDGKRITGYFRSADRSTGAINVSRHNERQPKDLVRSIGVRTLRSLRKFNVDRLGKLHEVKSEKWPGERKNPARKAK